jgi:heat shock protein HtpX
MSAAASSAFPAVPGPLDRVHFLDEQRHNRRQSWRFSLLGFAGVVVTGLPLCFLVTPFLFALTLLAAHIIDIISPLEPSTWVALKAVSFSLAIVFVIVTHQVEQMPPTVGALVAQVGPLITNAEGEITLSAAVLIVGMLVLPGAIAMLLGWLWLRVLFPAAGVSAVIHRLQAREPNPNDLEEHQLRNIVEEIAVAAGVQPPRLMLIDTQAANAAAVGLHIEDATIIVTRGLLDRLNRDETQAMIAHVIASVGNGDLKIMSIIVSMFQAWGLAMLVLSAPLGPKSRRVLGRLVRVAIRGRRREETRREAEAVAELLSKGTEIEEDDFDAFLAKETTPVNMVWHLPLLLSFGIASFGGKVWVQLLATTFFGATITQLWRSRRLLADATAVQLTRHPDALARAVVHLAELDVEPLHAREVPYLFAVWTRPEKLKPSQMRKLPMLMGMHPTLGRRLERLRALGAFVDPTPYRGQGAALRGISALVVIPLGLVMAAIFFGAVMLMMVLSLVVMMGLLMVMWGILQLAFVSLPGLIQRSAGSVLEGSSVSSTNRRNP